MSFYIVALTKPPMFITDENDQPAEYSSEEWAEETARQTGICREYDWQIIEVP